MPWAPARSSSPAWRAPSPPLATSSNPASNDTSQQFAPGSVQRQDTPNDPDYDYAEPDDAGPAADRSTNLYDERFGLFGFPSAAHAGRRAIYGDGPNAGKPQISGFNAAGAWKLERGRPDVGVAILDTGIKWDQRGPAHPDPPQHAASCRCPSTPRTARPRLVPAGCSTWRRLRRQRRRRLQRPRLRLRHRASAPAAGAPRHAGAARRRGPDRTRSRDGTDDDGNGFVDDIAGWDFFDNDNDPYDASSYFAAANHGSGRAERRRRARATTATAGSASARTARSCRSATWDTFVSDGNTFAHGDPLRDRQRRRR